MERTNARLSGPGQQKLDVDGMFEAQITHKDKSTMQKIYIVRDLKHPLLGKPAIEALSLISFVNVVDRKEQIVKKFSKLFDGLGKLDTEYHIELEEGAVPYAVHTARRIALPLLPKVKKELERLQTLGVIPH